MFETLEAVVIQALSLHPRLSITSQVIYQGSNSALYPHDRARMMLLVASSAG
jgi:hypothetical protein